MAFPQQHDPNVAYVSRHLMRVLTPVAGDRLVGIYPFGSLAFGDYVDHVSDMDFIAVVDGELPMRERTHLVAALTPDPAIGLAGAGLDLLVVPRADAAAPAQ